MGRAGSRLGRAARLSLIALAASLALAPPPAHAAFPGANGKIAYAQDLASGAQNYIYTINPDGSGATNLTPSGDISFHPAWSPDGTKIAFECAIGATHHICTMNADGSDQRDLGVGGEPSWSPDGTRIAFSGVKVMNSDGSDVRTIASGGAPEWSPDGTKILFTQFRCLDPECSDGTFDLWVMNRDGSGQALLRPYVDSSSWSPDGTKIIFEPLAAGGACPGTGPGEPICVMNADGTGVTAVDPGPGYIAVEGAWSPDGAKIAFASTTPGRNFDIYYMNPDGSGVTRVTTPDPGGEREPDWQPLPTSNPAPSYETPKLASPIQMSLVPVFKQCGTGGNPVNGSHSPPLSVGSCNPQTRGVAHFGAQATGTAWIATIYGDTNPANGDQADMTLRFDLSDIRTGAGTDYDPNPTGADGTLATRLRLTDMANGGSGSDPGTATEFDFSVPFNCTATSDPAVGSDCRLDTSADAVNPAMIKENKATVLQVFRLRLTDSGPNGVRGDGDDKLFAMEGVFVP
jgi:TolB protein